MSLIATAGRAILRFALSSIGGCLFAPGAAALSVWLLMASTDPRTSVWLGPVREFLLVEGIVFAAAGGCVILLVRWPPSDDFPDRTGAWTTIMVPGLLALAVMAGVVAWPLMAFGQETVSLLQTWGVWRTLSEEYGGVVLAPIGCMLLVPTLEAAAALFFVIAPVLLIPAMHLGNRLFTRVLWSCVLIQSALVHGGYSAASLMTGFSRPAADAIGTMMRNTAGGEDAQAKALLAWIARHDAITGPVAQRLIWVLMPSLALLAFASYSRRSALVHTLETEDYTAGVPLEAPVEEPAPAPADLEESFLHSSYLLKGSLISAPAYYPNAKVVFRVRKELFGLAGRTVLCSATDGRDLLAVAKRGMFSSTFDVTVPASRAVVGTVSEWSFTGSSGRLAGSIVETRLGVGFAKYVVRTRGLDCCTLTWSLPFLQSETEIEFAPGANRQFNPRMGLAIALILNDRARVRSMDDDNFFPFWRS